MYTQIFSVTIMYLNSWGLLQDIKEKKWWEIGQLQLNFAEQNCAIRLHKYL